MISQPTHSKINIQQLNKPRPKHRLSSKQESEVLQFRKQQMGRDKVQERANIIKS